MNIGEGKVEIRNISPNASKYVVARLVAGVLWYWGSWDTQEAAERVIKDNDFHNGLVIEYKGELKNEDNS